jgi:hypothetical protein
MAQEKPLRWRLVVFVAFVGIGFAVTLAMRQTYRRDRGRADDHGDHVGGTPSFRSSVIAPNQKTRSRSGRRGSG